ncbi:hypothetical protein M378DRAFT_169044 [Amanita muscaria Koide BX008]|uniref:Uncharacterized protein n=1 Tax=Amanita muscaria (strain Koide BX008) TaxID=946122 RepID=A0A0C2WSC9_AMAMK|nr:hypothetical protein M378DRAFT_169044 [Amanita muscaria Koide BX008]
MHPHTIEAVNGLGLDFRRFGVLGPHGICAHHLLRKFSGVASPNIRLRHRQADLYRVKNVCMAK